MKKLPVGTTIAILVLIATPLCTYASIAFDDDIAPAQGLVEVNTSNVAHGSAFCINSNTNRSYFLTAKHVIQDADPSTVIHIFRWLPVAGNTIPQARQFDADIAAMGKGSLDLAVLTVHKPCEKAMVLDPAPITKTTVSIRVAGFPISLLDALKHDESISGPASVPGTIDNLLDNGFKLQLNAGTVDCGSSGGPIYNPATGFAEGVTVAKYSSDEDDAVSPQHVCRPGQNNDVDYALPVQPVVIPFLQANHIPFLLPNDGSGTDGTNGDWALEAASSASVPFGVWPACSYRVGISLDYLNILIHGVRISEGNLRIHQTEENGYPTACPYKPLQPVDQTLDFVSGTVDGTDVNFAFRARLENVAKSNALFNGTLIGRSSLRGTITFVRNDTSGPWLWTVAMPVRMKNVAPMASDSASGPHVDRIGRPLARQPVYDSARDPSFGKPGHF